MKKTIIYLIMPFLLMLAACSSSHRVTSSWKAQDLSGVPSINKILVLGVINEKDRRIRENMEAQLVQDLTAKGYSAVGSMNEFGPTSFQKMTEETALKRLKSSNFDAVIIITLLDKSKERSFVPGSVRYQPYAVRYNRFWGYYSTYYDRVYTPGYYTTDTKFLFETSMYRLENKDNDLLYSAQSEAFDPGTAEEMASSYGKSIVNDMEKNGVIIKK